jgi:hypothetical protein
MPRLDAIHRPPEAFVVIPATPEMNAEAAALLSLTSYTRFERPPAWDAIQIMGRAIASTFGALDDDITMTEHFPEPFLTRFKYPHHRVAAVSRHDFVFDDFKIHVRPWRLKDNADPPAHSNLHQECAALRLERLHRAAGHRERFLAQLH